MNPSHLSFYEHQKQSRVYLEYFVINQKQFPDNWKYFKTRFFKNSNLAIIDMKGKASTETNPINKTATPPKITF
jgi:hypothetical protein